MDERRIYEGGCLVNIEYVCRCGAEITDQMDPWSLIFL